MLGGYQQTSGLTGMGCGVDTSCGCDRGMGALFSPSTWGPADYLIAGLATALLVWKLRGEHKERGRQRYRVAAIRRLEEY